MTNTAHLATAFLKESKLPVFFLQMGSNTSLFFDRVLAQAAITNGAENIFVLTDTDFDRYENYHCIDISAYAKTPRPFDGLYQHHSTNSYFFEKICFDRWFIINELIRDAGIDNFIYADCDVMILKDLKPFYDEYLKGNYDGTMMFLQNGDNSITSAHTSFWNGNLLTAFCSFINAMYADHLAFEQILTDAKAGKFYDNRNVSDMILLDVFRTKTQPSTLNLLSLDTNGIGFDFNMNASYNGGAYSYQIDNLTGVKKLRRRKGNGFYGIIDLTNNAHGTEVEFYSLHFQGYLTKALIPSFAQGQGNMLRLKNIYASRMEYLTRRFKILKNQVRALILKR